MTLSIEDSAWGAYSQLSTALCGTSGPVTVGPRFMSGFSTQRSSCAYLTAYCGHPVAQEIRGTAYLTAYQPKRKARRRGVLPSQRAFSAPQEGIEPPTKRLEGSCSIR